MKMKRIIAGALVPENTVDEFKAEITNLIKNKYGGEMMDIQVTDAPPKGAGLTLSGGSL